MSVLIKDMEIPETCDDCPFHVYHSHYEYVCKATPMFYPMNLANSKGIRKEWCPLSEVSSTQQEWLTDKEQRIFLAAMAREKNVCKQVDDDYAEGRGCGEPYEDSLVRTCSEIIRKVKGALWT